MIIDEDEIEIGGRRHLAAAKLAHGDDGAAAARNHAVALERYRSSTASCSRSQHDIGKIGKGAARLGRAHRFGQDADADAEHLLLGDDARAVDRLLERRARGHGRGDHGLRSPLGVGSGAEEAGIEHRIEHLGPAAQFARPAAAPCRESWRSDRAGCGLALSSEKSCTPAGRPARNRSKAMKAWSASPVRGKRGQQRRHEFGQKLAGAGAAGRGIAAEMPAADRRRQSRSPGGSPCAVKRLDGLGIILAAGEDEAAGLGAEFRRILEQRRIMALHRLEGRAQSRLEAQRDRQSRENRARLSKASSSSGSVVGLLVRHHLHAVLDRAQEAIGLRSARRRRLGVIHCASASASSMSSVRRPRSFGLRPPAISCWVWTKNSISRMPPRPSLMLWPRTAIVAMALDRVDLALERLHVGDGREVEIFAPDIGLEAVEELLAQRDVAGDGARLDHRGAFPVLAHILVVDRGRLDRDGDLGGARIGPQPQVDAEDIAVLGHVLQQADQPLGEAHEEGRRLDAVRQALPSRDRRGR